MVKPSYPYQTTPMIRAGICFMPSMYGTLDPSAVQETFSCARAGSGVGPLAMVFNPLPLKFKYVPAGGVL